MRIDKLASAAVAALEDIKGRDIVVLDVRKMTSLFDRIMEGIFGKLGTPAPAKA